MTDTDKICPIMSRTQVMENEPTLVEVDCKGKECALWVKVKKESGGKVEGCAYALGLRTITN